MYSSKARPIPWETIGHSISNATESLERPAEVTTFLGNETRFCGTENILSPQRIRATMGAPLGHTRSVRSLGARLAQCSSGLRWNSWQGIASGLRWRARPERVPGAARLTLQVSENPIDLGDR